FCCHIFERAVSIVVIQSVGAAVVSYKKVIESVIIVVADAGALPPAGSFQAGRRSDIGESAVALVVIKKVGRFSACWVALEAAAVHQENVRESVPIIIDHRDAASGPFEFIFLAGLAPIDQSSRKPG